MKLRDSILPVLRPHGDKEELELLKEVIESGWSGINTLLPLPAILMVKT